MIQQTYDRVETRCGQSHLYDSWYNKDDNDSIFLGGQAMNPPSAVQTNSKQTTVMATVSTRAATAVLSNRCDMQEIA
eukprot:4547834-Amphidinium_carterae.1